MKVLVCGGRTYKDQGRIYRLLDFNRAKITTIIHGDASGADRFAGAWAIDRGVPVEVYPAEWDKHGKRAGYLRNLKMAEVAKPDLVVAFPGGVGTKMMLDIAAKKGIRTIEVPT